MFKVSEFTKNVKGKYTKNISITYSSRIKGILSKNDNKKLYHLEKLMEFIDLQFLLIPSLAYDTDERYLGQFEKLLKDNERDFNWFDCWYNSGGVGQDLIMICSAVREEKIYSMLLRFENLKVFV